MFSRNKKIGKNLKPKRYASLIMQNQVYHLLQFSLNFWGFKMEPLSDIVFYNNTYVFISVSIMILVDQ